jgi:hypothetical protein
LPLHRADLVREGAAAGNDDDGAAAFGEDIEPAAQERGAGEAASQLDDPDARIARAKPGRLRALATRRQGG